MSIGRDLVGLQPRQVLVLGKQHAHVRSEKFVRGADEEVAVERAHVNWAVRRVMDRIDVGHGSDPVRHTDDFPYIVDGSHRVRGVANGYQPGAAGDFPRQVMHVQGAIPIMNFGHPYRDASFLQSQPGRIIGIMIKTSHYDLISGIEFTANRPAHGKGERGHVRAEDDLSRIAGKKVRHGATSAGKHRVGTLAGRKGAVGVGIAAAQIIRDGVDHGLGNLRPARAIEKNDRMIVDGLR